MNATHFRFLIFFDCFELKEKQKKNYQFLVGMDLCTAETESQQFNTIAARYRSIGLLSESQFVGEHQIRGRT